MIATVDRAVTQLAEILSAGLRQIAALDPREKIGAVTGLLGATCFAVGGGYIGYGFLFFLISNIYLISYFRESRNWGFLLMQIGFSVTSVIGLVRCLL